MHGSAQTGILDGDSECAGCGPEGMAQTDVRQDGAHSNRYYTKRKDEYPYNGK